MEGLMQLSISVLCLSAAARLWAKIKIDTVHSGTQNHVNINVKAIEAINGPEKKKEKK